MGKLTAWLLGLFFLILLTAPRDLAAQGFFSRLFKKGSISFKQKKAARGRWYYCGEMDAYNKRKTYKRHKRSRSRSLFARQSPEKAEGGPVARTKTNRKFTSPPDKAVVSKKQPTNPSPQLPAKQTTNPPVPVSRPSPPLAQKRPAEPEQPGEAKVEKKQQPVLTRTVLKKMTESQRRDTLQQIAPEVELEPIQFISNQDEFSVVNMDSFMQAMEYAQQGKVVLVEGHTDDIGQEAYNLDLSMKRAEKIRELLLSGGISDELISVIGYGETQPLLPNTSDENRAINRRIEFKIFSLPK